MMQSDGCSFRAVFWNAYKFTGKERDSESGLDMFGARYYGSSLGRFMTPDWSSTPTAVPYADFNDPQTLNQYGYVRNNPLFRADLDGHNWFFNCFIYGHCVSDEKIAEMAKQDRDWLKQNCISCYGKSGSDLDKLSNRQLINLHDQVQLDIQQNLVVSGTPPSIGTPVGPGPYVDLSDPARRSHILDGDATSGGHRPGTGISGKSEFPSGWSDDKIMHEISDVATDPTSRVTQQGRDTIVEGTREGINIRVVMRDGKIWTGYPTNVPRNP